MIFNLGAPSQMDTFDPKPEAAAEIRGPFSPISTRGGFQVTEILPRHAEVADKFSVVRWVARQGRPSTTAPPVAESELSP